MQGYTLIEILIVILIISIVATVAVLTINFNSNKQLDNLGKNISNLLSLSAEEAMLRPATLGLLVTDKDFQFYTAEEDNNHKIRWQPILTVPLNKQLLPKNTHITVMINGAPAPQNGKPQITITPSGDFSPFILLLSGKDEKPLYQVVQSQDGKIKSEKINETSE